ncbi:MAG: methyltransferase [Planctomycetota bacterium]
MVWSADDVLGLTRGFTRSRILLTAAELDIFSLLAGEALPAAEVGRRIGGDERAVTILLDALAAMELLRKSSGAYHCEPAVAALLTADAPRSVLPMVLHHVGMWRRWSELTGIVHGDSAARGRVQASRSDVDLRAFIGAMHVVGMDVAREIAALLKPAQARVLLDVGGASGTYTIACLEQAPGLRATLFDRPAVVEMARERLSEAGLLDRVTLVGGDFDTDELPAGHDLALLSAIIHQNSRAENVELYRKVWRALVPGGRLVIRDHVMSPDRTRPVDGAVFAVNMLVGTPGGNTYTLDETRADLTRAGFVDVAAIRTDAGMHSLVEATKPLG